MPDSAAKTNRVGLEKKDYSGSKSTLCIGCGHDQITRHIIAAAFESGIDPYNVVKTSGIGCSSKTPAYFIDKGFSINSVHGRMPSVATGANAVNKHLVTIGVSGDGDTASIGMGQFCHVVRRNVNMVYIIENNGVYGLTKGQFSATSEEGSLKKGGEVNPFDHMDMCTLALDMGCSFVARSFSGDAKQMVNLIRAGLSHDGLAVIDCISPCVTFNNLPGSTKGFQWLREHNVSLHEVGFVAPYEAEEVDQKPGEEVSVGMPDGSHIRLHALSEKDYDPTSFHAARQMLERDRSDPDHVYTGLIYYKQDSHTHDQVLQLGDKPLSLLNEKELRPRQADFEALIDTFH
ncbi:MAG: thiamine pyrophosphate-dependent enzyme [Planctomycetota bacterium]|jgi:2-oxoglutarate/2-oxoacid ferredoxin oxidoreductase subunit beta|nr:thiamine pyrophosphate-dependent enzyme [Planctomycetota bacterium]